MCAIHDIFLPDGDDQDDLILLKKLIQCEGSWDTIKDILGFVFNSMNKTMWLMEGKWDALLDMLKACLQATMKNGTLGIPFKEFWSVNYKAHHTFTAIPAGKGLLSPLYKILSSAPRVVFLFKH
jgi:hypothetical protein